MRILAILSSLFSVAVGQETQNLTCAAVQALWQPSCCGGGLRMAPADEFDLDAFFTDQQCDVDQIDRYGVMYMCPNPSTFDTIQKRYDRFLLYIQQSYVCSCTRQLEGYFPLLGLTTESFTEPYASFENAAISLCSRQFSKCTIREREYGIQISEVLTPEAFANASAILGAFNLTDSNGDVGVACSVNKAVEGEYDDSLDFRAFQPTPQRSNWAAFTQICEYDNSTLPLTTRRSQAAPLNYHLRLG